ncbi:hypothetical protein SAMN05421858_2256 [Haladaptatus litoreus]|uniref:Uncharacterized protein n=1 Tax=Haladaptatus litoreus TaxID=553468 RepID=A0A1N7A0G5_9EURY|nr:DUF5815 family protein [Haladaptatus litoreus]SIR32489.1 hypothetical protein SAMN05421858_2256 [Haladaptatus litoreus]
MAEPRVPGGKGARLDLPCGESVAVHELDMGMREYDCDCGESHAVVMDIHPPSRFVPEFLVDILRETVETTDDAGEFGTLHIMGVVLEEFPSEVVAEDMVENPEVGYGMVWVTDFDSRRLHEIVVELIVELMEHAVSHAEDEDAMSKFEADMLNFDVAEFVDQYRKERDFTGPHDRPA